MKALLAGLIVAGLAFASEAFAEDAMGRPAMTKDKMEKMNHKKMDGMSKSSNKMDTSGKMRPSDAMMDKKDDMSRGGMKK